MFGAFQFAAPKFADAPVVVVVPPTPVTRVIGWPNPSTNIPYDEFLRRVELERQLNEVDEIVQIFTLWQHLKN